MKKMMIVAAVAIAAICSQGSQVYWSLTSSAVNNASKDPPWTYFDTAANLTGMTAYLITASDWDSADVAGSLEKAQASTGFSTSTWDTTGKKAVFGTGNKTASGLSLEEGKDNFYIVISDGSTTYWQSSLFENVDVLADGSLETKYTAAKATLSADAAIKASDMKPMGDVPEPTSAMLLLLGVAGLALKRKQA